MVHVSIIDQVIDCVIEYVVINVMIGNYDVF